MLKAEYIKTVRDDRHVNQRLYKCSGEPATLPEYVIVSAAVLANETYIFKANSNGEVVSWSDLNGSFHGALDHERALRNAGYTVVTTVTAATNVTGNSNKRSSSGGCCTVCGEYNEYQDGPFTCYRHK